MTNFLDRMKAESAHRTKHPSDISLRGSGIRKRDMERDTKAYDKEAKKSIEKSQSDNTAGKAAEEKFTRAIEETTAAIVAETMAKSIVLDPSQLRALKGILSNQVCCLIGAAGTGKTTLERILISELSKNVKMIHIVNSEYDDETGEYREQEEREETPGISVAAYTGRAAQQSRKAIGEDYGIPIQTIHRLLGYAPTEEIRQGWDPITKKAYEKLIKIFRPSYGKARKLPYSVYIFDEASMIPIPLWNEFIDAIEPNARIIIVGDIHQLPPVYGKSVLGYALRKWPVFQLETIHRQAAGNAIISNAHKILNGKMIAQADNFRLLEAKNGAAQSTTHFQTYIRQLVQKLWTMGKFDPYRDVVIVPNSDPDIITSAPALNDYFMTLFNPEKTENGVIVNKRISIHTGTQHVYFAVGDKIMINQNINTVNPPITNGMMGIVEQISLNGKYDQKRSQVIDEDSAINMSENGADDPDSSTISLDLGNLDFALGKASEQAKKKEDESMDQRQASHTMLIKFETGQTLIAATSGDYRRLAFGYVITCHKSQGGEYPNVIIALHSANGALLSQEWLYTAVTRARNNVYLIHNERGLARAIKTQRIKGSNLAQKIQSYVIETKSDDVDGATNPWDVDRTKFPILFNPREV